MKEIYEMEIVGENYEYSLQEICQSMQSDTEFIIQCIDYGLTDVQGENAEEWRFSVSAIVRLQRAYRLQRDLDINFTGLGVVLDLLDDIEDLRTQLKKAQKKLKHWEN